MATFNLLGSLKLSRNASIISAVGASGFMDIYTGAPPTDVGTAATGTLIVSLPLSATSAVSGGAGTSASPAVLTFNAITTTNSTGAGTLTAGYARIRSAAQGAAGPGVIDLDVGTAGASVILNSVSIANGSPISITSATVSEG